MSLSRVLLVEDSPEDILFFRKACAQAGWTWPLEVVKDGQEAVDSLSARQGSDTCPSHLILDLKLPGVSGLQILEWIRAHPVLATLPVIILTSSQVPSDIHQASALGVDAFLVKPVSFKALVDVVHEIAARWKIPVAPVQEIAAPTERGRGSE